MYDEASEASSRSGPSSSSALPMRRCGMRLISACPASEVKNYRLMSVTM